jgi:hypothetical protein
MVDRTDRDLISDLVYIEEKLGKLRDRDAKSATATVRVALNTASANVMLARWIIEDTARVPA